jgi:hypothetical protein
MTSTMFRVTPAVVVGLAFSIACVACARDSSTAPSNTSGNATPSAMSSDAELFTFVTQTQPFRSYTRFPNLNTSADGTLPASSAHQPVIRVSMNNVAAGALQNGKLPQGASFPDGAVIFKEVLGANGLVNLYAVMYKDRRNALAGKRAGVLREHHFGDRIDADCVARSQLTPGLQLPCGEIQT